jgi:hypothetical protein
MYKTLAKFGVLLLLLNASQANQANEDRAIQVSGQCSKHKYCWKCVQDPCSRKVDTGCFWCPKCASNQCQDQDQALPSNNTWDCVKLNPTNYDQNNATYDYSCSCHPFQHFNYTVEYPTSDIHASQRVGRQRYDVWINMCGKIKDGGVYQNCGHFTPVEVIQQQIGSDTKICWDIGRSQDQDARCCSREKGNIIPGKFLTINVTVTMVAGSSHTPSIRSFGNFSLLTECSQRDSIDFVIETSQLTDSKIDWLLNASQTALQCPNAAQNDDSLGVVLQCRVYPVSVIPGRKVSGKVCKKHFTVKLSYRNDTQMVYNLSYFKSWDDGDELSFLIPKADLVSFEVDYSYYGSERPTPVTGGIANPVILAHHKSNKVNDYVYGGVGTFCVLMIVIIIVVYWRKCRRGDNYYRLAYLDDNSGAADHEQ